MSRRLVGSRVKSVFRAPSPSWILSFRSGPSTFRIVKPGQSVISTSGQIRIWVDADACPGQIKDLLIRTATRRNLELTFVANQSVRVPQSSQIHLIVVTDGADVADDLIADRVMACDIVITQDIPLAARVVEKAGVAIGPRGELFDDRSVHNRLATRNLMEQFRSAGHETRGPKPLNQKDVQAFANALDRSIVLCQKQRQTMKRT